jgi:hypothetical protein
LPGELLPDSPGFFIAEISSFLQLGFHRCVKEGYAMGSHSWFKDALFAGFAVHVLVAVRVKVDGITPLSLVTASGAGINSHQPHKIEWNSLI